MRAAGEAGDALLDVLVEGNPPHRVEGDPGVRHDGGVVASKWSLWSEGSMLSIGSQGSVLSIGSVGSALSIGSVNSAGSAFCIGSSASVGSLMSWLSVGSVMSAGGRGSFMGHRSSMRSPAMLAALVGGCAAATIVVSRVVGHRQG